MYTITISPIGINAVKTVKHADTWLRVVLILFNIAIALGRVYGKTEIKIDKDSPEDSWFIFQKESKKPVIHIAIEETPNSSDMSLAT